HDNFAINTQYGFNIDSEYNDAVNIQFNEILSPQSFGFVVGGTTRFNNFTFLYNEILFGGPGSAGVFFRGNVTNAVLARTNFLPGTASGMAIAYANSGNIGNVYQSNQVYSGFGIDSHVTSSSAASCIYNNVDENGNPRSDFRNNIGVPCRPGL